MTTLPPFAIVLYGTDKYLQFVDYSEISLVSNPSAPTQWTLKAKIEAKIEGSLTSYSISTKMEKTQFLFTSTAPYYLNIDETNNVIAQNDIDQNQIPYWIFTTSVNTSSTPEYTSETISWNSSSPCVSQFISGNCLQPYYIGLIQEKTTSIGINSSLTITTLQESSAWILLPITTSSPSSITESTTVVSSSCTEESCPLIPLPSSCQNLTIELLQNETDPFYTTAITINGTKYSKSTENVCLLPSLPTLVGALKMGGLVDYLKCKDTEVNRADYSILFTSSIPISSTLNITVNYSAGVILTMGFQNTISSVSLLIQYSNTKNSTYQINPSSSSSSADGLYVLIDMASDKNYEVENACFSSDSYYKICGTKDSTCNPPNANDISYSSL